MFRIRFWLVTALVLEFISGCAWFGRQAAQTETPAALIDIQHAGLLVNDQGQAELGLSLRNTSAQTLWTVITFQTPSGLGDCVLSSELAPASEHLFVCPQTALQAKINYPIQISAYSNIEQSQRVSSVETGLRFSEADIQAAGL